MTCAKDVAKLKKELKEMASAFRKFRVKAKVAMKKQAKADVEGQTTVPAPCGNYCIAWTSI